MLSTKEYDARREAAEQSGGFFDQTNADRAIADLNPNSIHRKLFIKVNAFTALNKSTAKDFYGKKSPWYYHVAALIVWDGFAFCCALWALYAYDKPWWDGVVYAGILAIAASTAIILDLLPDDTYGWKSFQSHFESFMGVNGMQLFGSLFFIVGLISWIIIALEEDDIWGGDVAYYIIYVSFYMAVVFCILFVLSGWELFSYYCATQSYVQGFMWLSIIGGAVLITARNLRIPPSHSDKHRLTWHKIQDTDELVAGLMWVTNMFYLFFVILGCVGVAVFADFSLWAADMGIWISLSLFTLFSFAVMLNPIAPGSVIDACGGFLFLFVFVKQGASFYLAYILGVVILVIYHYAGACIQWIIGRIPAVQIWLNTYIPVEILATSDAVLGDANWFRVGLIGYVFLDTLNGLNQGRINMEFWTQLHSEWACIPAAISLSALGASIAVQSDDLAVGEDVDWVGVAVPLLMMSSALIATLGGLFGAAALASSTDKKKCWTAREKWTAVHYFHAHGYSATQDGWLADIYQLASEGDGREGSRSNCLFAKTYPKYLEYVARRGAARTEAEKLRCLDMISAEISNIRKEHFKLVEQNVAEYLERGLFVKTHVPENSSEDFWASAKDKPARRKLQIFILGTLIFTYWGSIVGFFMAVPLEEAVGSGTGALPGFKGMGIFYWVCLVYFAVAYSLYNYKYFIDEIIGMWTTTKFVLTGCKLSTDNIETLYPTPEWEVPEDLEREVLQNLKDEFGPLFQMVDPVEHMSNQVAFHRDARGKSTISKKKKYEN